jgi:hypothetical protein
MNYTARIATAENTDQRDMASVAALALCQWTPALSSKLKGESEISLHYI